MIGKNNIKKQNERRGEKIETYSIKKFKVGAASVLIGVGLFFGVGVVEASDNATVQQSDNKKSADSKELDAPATTTVEVKPVEKKTENTREKVVEAVAEKLNPQTAEKIQQEVDKSLLLQKIRELKAQLERIKNNSSQQLMINDATSKLAAAETLLQTSASQQEVDKKAKEISSLTFILKSIKVEETVKENKKQDSRNGKKIQEGTGFRADTPAGTGVGADVVDATSTPAVARGEYTKREDAEAFTKQVTWLDFGDVAHWENIDNEGGKIYLKEGSKYSKEVIPGYIINIKVKSLKPFQATEIYRKRMEAANASEEEKATFNPNATNQHFGEGSGPSRVTADQQDGEWSEVRNNGINTGNKKTAIGAGNWSNIGVQFEISATYKGKNVRPAVIMNDSESANHGENIILTTNGSPWERVLELKKERFVGGTFTPTPYKPINNYNLRHEDYPQSGSQNNAGQLLGAMRGDLLTLADGTKFAPKYMTNPDQEMGGLGTGVFGPVTSSGGYSLPILMTKDATEVGLYILSSGIQTAMMGVIPVDEGDAPESYGKASHTINTVNGVTGGEVKQPYLGSTRPDMDTGTTKDWYGDDKDIDADEGINQLLPDNLKDSEGNIIKANISKKGYYKLNVQAHTGGAEKAYIRSWIDFNNNGKFDEDEGSEIAEITKDGEVSLEFKNKTSKDAGDLLEAGTRVRIATNKAEIQNPTGNAFSGEVEDFKTKITHPPKGEKKETVGNIKETQKEEIHFTVADGKKNVYVDGNPSVEIDKNVAPVYFDNKTGQQVTLSSDNTYTVEGEGTYKFIVAENGIDVKVEFTPADGFIGKAHGVSIRRQDTNKTTTDWGNFDTTKDPNVNNILDSMDGLYIPEVTPPAEVVTSVNNAESKNIQGLPQKGQPTFNVETAKDPVTPSAKYPAKLVDPATGTVTTATTVNALEQGTNKVIGTYTIVPETGEVTFTPNKDFKGVPAPVTVSAEVELSHDKDGNITKKTLTGTYTPTIIPVAPTSENAKSEGIQGATQEGTPVFKPGKANVGTEENPVEKTVPLTISATNPAKFVVDGQPVETTTIPAKEGDKEVGTYTIDPATGKVTFTPNKDYSGTPTPVTVQAKDDNGTPATATYSPVVKPAVPTADKQKTTDVQGAKQTATPVFTPGKNTVNNEEVEVPFEPTSKAKLIDPSKTGEEAEVTSLEVPNQGTYTIDDNGVVTFIPLPTFTGEATPVSIVRKDKNGTPATATYTPKVVGVTPKSENVNTEGIQGATQEATPVFKAGKVNVGTEENPVEKTVPITISATNPAKFVVDGQPVEETTIPAKEGDKEVGTYTIEPTTGKVTFTPNKDYHGTPTPVTVQAKDDNGTPTTATYSPTVTPVTPEGTPAETTGIQGATQEGTPTFKPGNPNVPIDEEVAPTLEGANPEGKVVVPGEGTYTVDKDGKVTFTPEPQFTGVAKGVTVKRVDKNGTEAIAKYTPTVTPITPTGTPVESTEIQGKEQVGTPTFKPGNSEVPITITDEQPAQFVVDGTPVTEKEIPAKDKGGKVVGKYTVDPKSGKVTFTPNKDFTGTPVPATVQVKDANGTPATATYTPTVTPVTPTAEPKETTDIQGKEQTGKPTFKPGNPEVPIDDEVPVTFEDGSTEKVVPGEGTYKVNPDGTVMFTPEKGFTGTGTGVTVKRVDKNGTPVTVKYTPTVTPVTPTGEVSETEGARGAVQKSPVVFDTPDQDNTTVNFNKGHEKVDLDKSTLTLVDKAGKEVKEVKVPGEGTYLLKGGVIEFTPEKDFVGKASGVTVQVKDENGKVVSKTYTPTVRPDTKFVVVGKDGKETELIPSKDGEKPSESVPGYKVFKTVKDKDGNTKHIYEKVRTSFKDKEGKEIPNYPTEEGTTPKKDNIPGYRFVETNEFPNGDTEHVYEKVTTSYKDKEGNVIPGNPTEAGEQPNKAIPGYKFVTTNKLPNGDIEYVYEKVTIEKGIIRDKEGNPIPGFEFDRMSPILDIPEYVYVETVTDPDGTVRHIYRSVETVHKDKDGNPILNVTSKEKGTKESKAIPGYRLVGTKKLPNGDVEHVYEKVKGTTTWVDEYGNVLIPKEEGILDSSKVSGYEFVRTDADKEGNVRHVFKKASTSSSPVVNVTTSWIDEEGTPIKVSEKGTHEHGVIPGYEYVRTVTDKNENVRHIFRKVILGEEKVQVKHLANTGTTETNTGLAGLGLAVLGGLLAATKRRKDK